MAAAAFVGYLLLLLRVDVARPASAGFSFTIDAGVMRVESVVEGSPADRAGLQRGDRILAAGGRSIRSRLDWSALEANMEPPSRMSLDLARGDTRETTTLALEPTGPDFWLTGPGLTLAVARLAQLATLLLALVVAVKQPFDPIARVGAWLLGSVSVYSLALPYGLAAAWRDLPWPLALVLWIPYTSSLLVAPIVFTFFSVFPRPLFRSALAWVAVWIPAMPTLLGQVLHARAMVYAPDQPAPAEPSTWFATATIVGYVIAAVAAVAIGYRHETDVTTRRRVRIVACGATVGLLAVVPIVISYWQPDAVLTSSVFTSPAAAIGTVLGLTLPASFAYAILRHRLFDVHVIVRRSLQYVLARRVLVSIVPLLAAAFVIDLWVNRQVAFGEILQSRGWIYPTLAGLAILAGVRRNVWLNELDRRFFREQYNAERVLRSIGDQVRQAPTLKAAAPYMVARIEEALHPEVVALLMRQPGERQYRALAVAPSGVPIDPLPAGTAVAGLLALLRQPVRITPRDHDSLLRRLPREDVAWVRQHRLELLVPGRFGADAPEAFLVLGAKRSEEPYSAADEDMLMTIAHGVALLLPRSSASGFEECPVCGRCYEPGTGSCEQEGSALTYQPGSQLLADRYRLDHRIGRGGMGTVYAADDLALERRVAVKLLREDVSDPSAAERFRAEARTAGALSHPNIVTVYDIGITAAGRPFFVMELLDGLTLDEALRREGRLAPGRVLDLLKGVGAAVNAAHDRELIHRDLKPANIFLCHSDTREVPKVLDFGLAKTLEATRGTLTQSGLVAGTPRYMAPEHLRGGEASPDWDLWALAAIALEMLAGSDARRLARICSAPR